MDDLAKSALHESPRDERAPNVGLWLLGKLAPPMKIVWRERAYPNLGNRIAKWCESGFKKRLVIEPQPGAANGYHM
jgi:hypothetical protein